jgi:hypothetical protein
VRNPAKDNMRIWAAVQKVLISMIVSNENFNIAAQNRGASLPLWR